MSCHERSEHLPFFPGKRFLISIDHESFASTKTVKTVTAAVYEYHVVGKRRVQGKKLEDWGPVAAADFAEADGRLTVRIMTPNPTNVRGSHRTRSGAGSGAILVLTTDPPTGPPTDPILVEPVSTVDPCP